jgi:hypothetical protein
MNHGSQNDNRNDPLTESNSPQKSDLVFSSPCICLLKGSALKTRFWRKLSNILVNGCGFMSTPISTSPDLFGFGPQLSLSYDFGAGNEPFEFGWNLSLPSITLKTDKGLTSKEILSNRIFIFFLGLLEFKVEGQG